MTPEAIQKLMERVDAPFWSDDFDMDMLKVLPITEADADYLRSVELWTYGHTTHGRLNHPSCWNGDQGSIAFFGTTINTGKPAGYWTSSPLVRCTALEAFRDAWAHNYLMIVDNKAVVWNPEKLWPSFEAIMCAIRGWPGGTEAQREAAVQFSLRSLGKAIRTLRALQSQAAP